MLAVIGDTYQVIERIGQGGAGEVYLAYHIRLRKYVVLKRSILRAADMELLRTEVDTLKELHHPTLPQVYDFLEINGDIFTVIDYIAGEDCERIISSGQRFSEEMLAGYLLDLAKALVYLHQQEPPILHSDIKPGNIMIRQDGSVVLIDFNIAVSRGMGIDIKGLSGDYASPEQHALAWEVSTGNPITARMDERSDIYSLGATFYYLMTGAVPREQGLVPLSAFQTGYSKDLIRIVERAMNPDPDKRYQTALQLQQQLEKYFRRGKNFRQKCIAQAAVVFACGMIICCGIWSVAHGLMEKRHEEFSGAYSAVVRQVQQGRYQDAISDGIYLLNEYADEQEHSPTKWFYLLRFMGESYSTMAYEADTDREKEQLLREAAAYYYDAAILAMSGQLEEQDAIVNSCADIFLELGDTANLERLKAQAERVGIKTVAILDARLLAAEGKKDLAMSKLQLYIAAEAESHNRAKAYQAMAAITGENTPEGIELLEAAVAEYQTEEGCRSLARACMSVARRLETETAREYYTRAAEYYGMLFEHGVFSDMMGGLAANRAAENYDAAERILESLCKQYPNRFEVLAQGALLRRQMELLPEAKEYAAAALKAVTDEDRYEYVDLLNAMERILNEV